MSNYTAHGPTPLGENSTASGANQPADALQQLGDAVGANGHNGHHPATLTEVKQAARSYQQRGWAVITYPTGHKYTTEKNWQTTQRLTPEAINRLPVVVNLGLLTGEASNNLTDFDFDVPEAVAAAEELALPTHLMHGRASVGIGHRWYVATELPTDPVASATLRREWSFTEDPNTDHTAKTMYCELRIGRDKGALQTMVPPSWHPDGERLRWIDEGQPSEQPYADLVAMGNHIGATTLLARHWPAQGLRHVAGVALSGGLVRAGWTDAEVDTFVQRVARLAGDDEWRTRGAGASSRARITSGQTATGFPRLSEYLRNGELVVEKLCEWLGLDTIQFGSGLPRIATSGRPLRDVEEDSRHALEQRQLTLPERDRLYTQGGALVWVREQRQGPLTFLAAEMIPSANLAVELSRAADYVGAQRGRPAAGQGRRLGHVGPPPTVVHSLLRSRDWKLDALRVITSTPILHADGSIVTEPGYDPATGALYWPAEPLVLPDIPLHPTDAQARAALAAWQEVYAQFPFDSDESYANMLAAQLTLVIRRAIDDLVPAPAINAPEMGYGKSLLAKAACMLASGELPPAAEVPTNEDEWGKQILAWLRAGRDVIFLDNIEGALQSAKLEAVLTTRVYTRRDLGVAADATAPNEAVWILTGNNLVLKGALPRRVYSVRLAGIARPLERPSSSYAHYPLDGWVKQERARLLAAGYTLYRRWLTLGKPAAPHGRELASYETWSHTVGGILACVGVDAFLATAHEQMADLDPSRDEWEAFIAALAEAYPYPTGFKASDLYHDHIGRWLNSGYSDTAASESDPVYATLPAELQVYLQRPGPLRQQLGVALNERRGRVFGGWLLQRVVAPKGGHAATYRIKPAHTEKGA